jgi:hypothetical protein
MEIGAVAAMTYVKDGIKAAKLVFSPKWMFKMDV